ADDLPRRHHHGNAGAGEGFRAGRVGADPAVGYESPRTAVRGLQRMHNSHLPRANRYNSEVIFIVYKMSFFGSESIQVNGETPFISLGKAIGLDQGAPASVVSIMPAPVRTNMCLASLPKMGP